MLTKNVGVSNIIPGTPGSPGSPGVPAVPSLCTTYTWPNGENQQPGSFVTVGGYTVPTNAVSTPYDYWVNNHGEYIYHIVCNLPVPAKPPIPAIPPTPAVFLTTSNTGWNGGAVSIAMQSGSCAATFAASNTSAGVFTGFLPIDVQNSIYNYTHAIYQTHDSIRFYESGTQIGPIVSVAATDTLGIVRVGSTVTYTKNGVTLYTSTVASSGSIRLATTLYTAGDIQL